MPATTSASCLLELKQFPEAREQLDESAGAGRNRAPRSVSNMRRLCVHSVKPNWRRSNSSSTNRNAGQADHALAASKTAQGRQRARDRQILQKPRRLYREASRPILTMLRSLTSWRSLWTAPATQQPSARSSSRRSKSIPTFALAQNQLGLSGIARAATLLPPKNISGWPCAPLPVTPRHGSAWPRLSAWSPDFLRRKKPLPAPSNLSPDNAEALQLRKDLTAAQEQR